ncbi:MAG: TauD/TfdA family dioxygenase [Nocardioidaceae bacterium]
MSISPATAMTGLAAPAAGRPPLLPVEKTGDPAAWAAEHRDALRAVVREHGSVLVRGLDLREDHTVAAVFRRIGGDLMTEREGFASRRTYADGVYSSSTWPPNQPMCMHHELSYRTEVPGLLILACLTPPADGGATGLADATAMLDALPPDLVERFARDGWQLRRTYNGDVGRSMAEAFGTEDQAAVEAYCQANGIAFEWRSGGELRTRQRRPAVVRHPITGRRCWFNQVAFLSEWTMDPDVRDYLVEVYGAEALPFATYFGNGDPIGGDVVQLLNDVYDAHTVRERWQAGDLLLVDNVRTAHSREPYEGNREVLVAMAEPTFLTDPASLVEVAR